MNIDLKTLENYLGPSNLPFIPDQALHIIYKYSLINYIIGYKKIKAFLLVFINFFLGFS